MISISFQILVNTERPVVLLPEKVLPDGKPLLQGSPAHPPPEPPANAAAGGSGQNARYWQDAGIMIADGGNMGLAKGTDPAIQDGDP
jgi:hypothetical protein